MIKDKIKNGGKWGKRNIDLPDLVKDGIKYISDTDFSQVEDGKLVLSDNMYVNIQTYETKEDADFEAHREYIDIQYMISGEELIGVTGYNNCKTTIPYDTDRDIEFLSGEGDYHHLKEGEFMILYPDDAHKPAISVNKKSPQTVRKAVVKVRFI